VSLRSRLPLLGDRSARRAADVSQSGSDDVADELTPQAERKGEMSSLEYPGFPPAPAPTVEGHDVPAGEPFAAPELAPLQRFNEVQRLQPLETPVVESHPIREPEEVEVQTPALASPEPTMPPPLPLLPAAEPAGVEALPAATSTAPPPSSEEVANLGVPLGTLIFRSGLLTEEQLEDALQEGVRSGKRLGEVLLEGGLIDERDLGRLLADQKGLRFVELSQLALHPAATGLLSSEKAHMFAALPVGFEEGLPVVAVADPSNELVTENLRRALLTEPRLVVASRSDLHETIDRVHAAPAEEPEPEAVAAEPEPVAEPQAEVAPLVVPVAPETPAPSEPALRPVEVAQVEPFVAETPQAEVVPVPAPVVPEPAPLPIVSPSPEPVATEPAGEPEPEPTFGHIEERQPEPEQATEQELPTALSYEVSLRLSDGERVPVGSFSDPQKAREYAREVVKHLSDDTDGWPFFSGRFMRPDTIVSVDIVPIGEPDRWLGSSMRSNWASRLNR
jgi:hypothetical protein